MIPRRTTGLGLLLSGAMMLGAALPAVAGEATPGATPGATPSTGASYTLASQQTYGGDGIQPLSLSPDGTAVATLDLDQDEVCSSPTITREAPTCAPFGGSVYPDSVAWSPDGTRFAFTENFPLYLDEPDIHIFDVATGEITNLTDDGLEGSPLDQEESSDIDLAPTWSPDGTEILFARSRLDDGDGTAFFRIAADGSGEAERITDPVTPYPVAVYGGVHWTADDRILYSVAAPTDAPDNGIWSISADGDDPEQLVIADAYRTIALILVDVNADGTTGLVLDQAAAGQATPSERPTHYLLDLTSGDMTPLDFGAGDLSPSERLATDSGVPTAITAVGFSPSGDTFAAAVSFPGGSPQLWMVDVATLDYPVAGDLDQSVGAAGTRPGIEWGANDLALAPAGGNTGVLMVLEPAD